MRIFSACLGLLLLAASPPDLVSPIVHAGIVNDGAPYPECHASTLVETAPGRLVAAWFGGTKERYPDVGIWVAHGDGTRWEPAREVANGVLPDGRGCRRGIPSSFSRLAAR